MLTNLLEKKVKHFIKKWEDLKFLDKKRAIYIKTSNSKPGTMNGLVVSHKENNQTRVITSECGTAVEFLSIFVNKIDFRIKDTSDMLNITENINSRNIITKDSVFVSFDVVSMFRDIDSVLGLEAISEILHNRESDFLPAECILDALKLCLECNNSVFKDDFYLQVDGQAMYPHMSYSYSDIAMYKFDV